MRSRESVLGPLVPGVFAPVLLFEVGIGAVLPVVPLTALQLGAGVAGAAGVAALLGVGQLVADLPAGALAARIGDRRALMAAGVAVVGTLTWAALAGGLLGLALAVTATGAANAVFLLARQSYLAEATPVRARARAMSTLAGMQRLGLFVGPFLGSAAIALVGLRGAFWLGVVTSAVSVVVLALVLEPPAARDPARVAGGRGDPGARTGGDGQGDAGAGAGAAAGTVPRPAPPRSLLAVARDHRHVLLTLGTVALLVAAARGARQTVLPLWTDHLGMSAEIASLVVGVSGAADVLLFYPAGRAMDRWGRAAVGVPSMAVLGLSLALLPLTGSVAAVLAVAALMGAGNGMGSGLLMTIGVDVAPPGERARFLGVWRLVQDVGFAVGPLAMAAVAAGAGLAPAVLGMAGVAGVSVLAQLRWVRGPAARGG